MGHSEQAHRAAFPESEMSCKVLRLPAVQSKLAKTSMLLEPLRPGSSHVVKLRTVRVAGAFDQTTPVGDDRFEASRRSCTLPHDCLLNAVCRVRMQRAGRTTRRPGHRCWK